MIALTDEVPSQILLMAPDLLGESLKSQLNSTAEKLEVCLNSKDLTKHPSLVIWALESVEMPSTIQIELKKIQDYWSPAPLLLLLPSEIRLSNFEILQFGCSGLLQDPDLKTLKESINTLINGGRVVRLKDSVLKNTSNNQTTIGLGHWLLISGIQQIEKELVGLDSILNRINTSDINKLLIQARRRELLASRTLLYFVWGGQNFRTPFLFKNDNGYIGKSKPIGLSNQIRENLYSTDIHLKERSKTAIWHTLRKRLDNAIDQGLTNNTGRLLAIEALSKVRQKELLSSIINQLNEIILKLQEGDKDNLDKEWLILQHELKRESLRQIAGSYVRLPKEGDLKSVSEELLLMTDLNDIDEELPDPYLMLNPLVAESPVQVEGLLLPPDDPRALIQLETYYSNWLIRTSELISSDILGACGEWPELRQYLLNNNLVSTRELERLRNLLNAENRWQRMIRRPINLYESKRLFYTLRNGSIENLVITEPRDNELRQLGWWQQQVALVVEARDALAPQLQAIVKKLGDIMVIVLTQVIGRAIGLVGRGIAQGMGKSLGRS